jgi:cytosine deaminase
MDPWYGLGSGDMLEVAHMAVHVAQMTSQAGLRAAFDAVTVNAAKAIGLSDYGIAVGNPADFVILQARDPIEAIRLKANRLAVARGGAIIARSEPRIAALSLPGRPASLDASGYAP